MKFLVGDVGGTKTLLAIFTNQSGKFQLERKEKFLSHEYHGLEEILTQFLRKETIGAACVAFAGPVDRGMGKATNLPWSVDAKKIEERFSIPKVFILNDLVSNAEGIQELHEEDFYVLNRGVIVDAKANQALISAGTGLGESIIIEGTHPSHSEGGHVDFSPRDELEVELFFYLKKKFGHVSYERVLSGPGLFHLYQFLVESGLEKASQEVQRDLEKEDPSRIISRYGVSKKCPVCYRALLWFSSLYGAEAGNLALKSMALGGIFVGGGIAPSILPILKEGAFMKGFIDKGRFSSLLEKIPVKIILKEETALIGSLFFLKKNFFYK